MDRLLSYNGEAIEYNKLGNPTVYRDRELTWSHVNRLASFDGVEFKYNYQGVRLFKTVNGKTTKYYCDGAKVIAQENNTDMLYFYYGTEGVTGFKYNGKVYHYKKDMLGNILGIYGDNGSLLVKYVYDAWGNHKTYVLNNQTWVDISNKTAYTVNSSLNEKLAILNPFRYRSYYYDIETGLYYLQSRYYDPETGRFISMDSIEYLDPESIHGLNLYAYCANNPVMNIDPSGCFAITAVSAWIFFKTVLIGFAFGFTASGVYEIGKQAYNGGNWNWNILSWDWGQIRRSAFGGGVAGAISAMPLYGQVGAFVFGGFGAAIGGLISGSVTDAQSFVIAFEIGAITNFIAYGINDEIINAKASKIFNQGSKAKSLAVQKLQGHPLNMGTKVLSGSFRNSFKQTTQKEIVELIKCASPWFRFSVYSSMISSFISGWY